MKTKRAKKLDRWSQKVEHAKCLIREKYKSKEEALLQKHKSMEPYKCNVCKKFHLELKEVLKDRSANGPKISNFHKKKIKCKKASFNTKKEAKLGEKFLWNAKRRLVRSYKCEKCKKWHHTRDVWWKLKKMKLL